MRTREYIEKGESEGKSLLDAMRDGSTEGMQYFDGEIEKLIRAGDVDYEAAFYLLHQRRKSCVWSWPISLKIVPAPSLQLRQRHKKKPDQTEIDIER